MGVKTRAFALKLKDKQSLVDSSSGGAFTAFSNYYLSNKGAIASAIYNYKTAETEYKLYNDYKTRDSARGSKYMQSYPKDIFKSAEAWLKTNDGDLLFVGVGCQSDGFRHYIELKGLRERVTIIDIICHGSPSPIIWKEYAKMLGDFSKLNFRDKKNGWQNPTAHVDISNQERSVQDYLTIFYNKCALRPCCYECPYATTERQVDLTIGDFWGIDKALPEFNKDGGVSLVLVHTTKGQKLFDEIKETVDWDESDIKLCLQPNLIRPTEKSDKRDQFWKDYKSHDIQYILKKYATKPSVFKRAYLKGKGICKRIMS